MNINIKFRSTLSTKLTQEKIYVPQSLTTTTKNQCYIVLKTSVLWKTLLENESPRHGQGESAWTQGPITACGCGLKSWKDALARLVANKTTVRCSTYYHYGVANEVCTESSAQPCSKAEAWSTPNTKCWQRCGIQERASIAGWTRTQYSHCKTVWGCRVSDALNIGSSNQSPWYLFVSPQLCIVPSKFQDVRHN